MPFFPAEVVRVMDAVDQLRHRVDDYWQIPRDEAEVLAQLVRIARSRSICEVGTSYGFSTLQLAAAAREHRGVVHTIDHDPAKVAAATRHVIEAGLAEAVTFHQGDASATLRSLTPAAPFDFGFIDATKDQSFDNLEAVLPRVAATCLFATDNTTTHAEELAAFVTHLRGLPGVVGAHVAVGNGFELAIRRVERSA